MFSREEENRETRNDKVTVIDFIEAFPEYDKHDKEQPHHPQICIQQEVIQADQRSSMNLIPVSVSINTAIHWCT